MTFIEFLVLLLLAIIVMGLGSLGLKLKPVLTAGWAKFEAWIKAEFDAIHERLDDEGAPKATRPLPPSQRP